jgi:hypothetical protein
MVLARCARRSHGDAIPFPARGAAFDISKEGGDSAGGKIEHDPLHTLGWMWFCLIVACR